MFQTTLPPGTYYVGDPLYALEPEDWPHYCRSVDHRPGFSIHRGHRIAAFPLPDGFHLNSNQQPVPVDSGCIAALPMKLVSSQKTTPHALRLLGTFVESTTELHCRQDQDGTLHFGDLAIYPAPPTPPEEPIT